MASPTSHSASSLDLILPQLPLSSPSNPSLKHSKTEFTAKRSVDTSTLSSSFSLQSRSLSPDHKNIYLVKNLDTGESIDIRDENSHSFGDSYSRVVGRIDKEIEIKEFL
jgi:hypothetical protein